ncbi:MAG: 1-(5-phosphoribosyl)-5-[(5-phosphoribosylamino)methylideneamino]imidazole-4-carboxamide isomerase [Oscillospiraceae bacterium]|jgi:phosphoribosylformimino-5-aminoimidazole carboxamide ribotide isomerase|nr:1-(5-phosphoribosyl)-5-[(5-phosphoribosylamino)methylideneamino]imidazole-4-carboxamide isomerase [Oscillospiraceae bacterium]
MIIFPAIDLKGGECVRLWKGEFGTAHKVADSYMETAFSFVKAGAEWIHIIDLDGAKDAERKNREIVIDIAKNTPLKVQTGGGIRSIEDVDDYLNNGVSRVIIGSAAVKNPGFVKQAVKKYGGRIAVGIDAKNGIAATEGWLESSGVNYIELALEMCKIGVKYFIFTDIDKDGTLSRPNHFKTKKLQEKIAPYGADVIASGGIKTLENIKTLKKNGVCGAICGKSIYSGTLDLKKAIEHSQREKKYN